MSVPVRLFLSLILCFTGYECLVFACDEMNLPSDIAVYKGMALLVLLATFLPFALWRTWRSML